MEEEYLVARHEALSSRRRRAGLGADDADGDAAPGSGGGSGEASTAVNVAAHYNSFADRHRSLTAGSDILCLRNLNNWVKSVLIRKHMPRSDKKGRGGPAPSGPAVLDLACGKGGDMLKFRAGDCALYVGIDVAVQSVRDAVSRYNGMNGRQPMPFRALFVAGDFCDPDPNLALDKHLPSDFRFALASCQMALHYSFRSEATASALLANAASRLHPGGTFVATFPDANVLVRRLRAAPGLEFGNAFYRVRFDADSCGGDAKTFGGGRGPFGLAYRFSLHEAVEDCEEYLVHLPTLVRLAQRVGLELLYASNFTHFFKEHAESDKYLLDKMRVMPQQGAIPEEEWEVSHLYLAVAFRKKAGGGGAPPVPTVPNTGHIAQTPADVIMLGNVAEDGERAAYLAASSRPGEKRPREPSPPPPPGESRRKVRYDDDDALWD